MGGEPISPKRRNLKNSNENVSTELMLLNAFGGGAAFYQMEVRFRAYNQVNLPKYLK